MHFLSPFFHLDRIILSLQFNIISLLHPFYFNSQISPRVDLPVGQNLHDHMGAFGLSWTVKKKRSAYSLLPLFNPITLKEYTLKHTGKKFVF